MEKWIISEVPTTHGIGAFIEEMKHWTVEVKKPGKVTLTLKSEK